MYKIARELGNSKIGLITTLSLPSEELSAFTADPGYLATLAEAAGGALVFKTNAILNSDP